MPRAPGRDQISRMRAAGIKPTEVQAEAIDEPVSTPTTSPGTGKRNIEALILQHHRAGTFDNLALDAIRQQFPILITPADDEVPEGASPAMHALPHSISFHPRSKDATGIAGEARESLNTLVALRNYLRMRLQIQLADSGATLSRTVERTMAALTIVTREHLVGLKRAVDAGIIRSAGDDGQIELTFVADTVAHEQAVRARMKAIGMEPDDADPIAP